jgi:hypothetical protein
MLPIYPLPISYIISVISDLRSNTTEISVTAYVYNIYYTNITSPVIARSCYNLSVNVCTQTVRVIFVNKYKLNINNILYWVQWKIPDDNVNNVTIFYINEKRNK